jgi:hypothetical protein
MQRTFDVQSVREQFPALRRTHNGLSVAYFEGPGGSQVARPAIEAMSNYMERGGANLHGVFPTSTETEEILTETRRAAADFLGTSPGEIAFGANMTTLTFAVPRALARDWDEDSEIVVTELDHRANVDPWTIAAAERGRKYAGSESIPRPSPSTWTTSKRRSPLAPNSSPWASRPTPWAPLTTLPPSPIGPTRQEASSPSTPCTPPRTSPSTAMP